MSVTGESANLRAKRWLSRRSKLATWQFQPCREGQPKKGRHTSRIACEWRPDAASLKRILLDVTLAFLAVLARVALP